MGSRSVPKALLQSVLAVLFMAGILLPGTSMILGIQGAESDGGSEKTLAFPAIGSSTKSVLSFPLRFREYYAANFGFRRVLVRSASMFRLKVLGVSSSAKVAVGKQGWLFFTGETERECTRRTDSFSTGELEHWKHVLEARKKWLENKGIRYVFIVAPDKHTVYPEYLPSSLRPLANPSGLDQFITYIRENSTVEIIDLRPVLAEQKDLGDLYYRLDTHWNKLGALTAYHQIMCRIEEWYPALKPRDMSEFDILMEQRQTGDLAGMLGLRGELSETYPEVYPKFRSMAKMVRGKEGYADKTNIIMDRVVYENAKGAPLKLLVTRDSFCTALIPYLSQHFRQSVFLSTYDLNPKTVEEEKPDIVIQEMVERWLMRYEPVWKPE